MLLSQRYACQRSRQSGQTCAAEYQAAADWVTFRANPPPPQQPNPNNPFGHQHVDLLKEDVAGKLPATYWCGQCGGLLAASRRRAVLVLTQNNVGKMPETGQRILYYQQRACPMALYY